MKKIILTIAILTTLIYGVFINVSPNQAKQNEIYDNCQKWSDDGKTFNDCMTGTFTYRELKKLNSK